MTWPTVSARNTLLFLLALLCTGELVWSDFERSCSSNRHDETPLGLCGPDLSTILSIVCKMYNKRSVSDVLPPPTTPEPPAKKDKGTMNGVFLDKKEAMSIFKRELIVSGTITCECCVHQCNIRELRQYCSVPEPFERKRRGFPHHVSAQRTHAAHLAKKRHIGNAILSNQLTWWLPQHVAAPADD